VIDLHTHILPGVDDGPANLAGSLAVAEVAYHGGTRTVAATPHLRADHPNVTAAGIKKLVASLRAERGIGLRVETGAEVDLDAAEALPDAELAQATLAGNGRDLLVEAPYYSLDGELPERLRALTARGFRLTLAHPERCPDLCDSPAVLGGLVEDGVLVQVTARSLGKRGAVGESAAAILDQGLCHVLASDAHAMDVRPPDLGTQSHRAQAAFPWLADELRWMVNEAPAAILAGAELPPRPARGERPRRRLLRR
jgi:protein-tyrosine phosphatase